MGKTGRLTLFSTWVHSTPISMPLATYFSTKYRAKVTPIDITSFWGKMCVNRSWKIPQSDHFYINQENGFCQDFVDCNGFFGLRGRLQVNKSVTILIQSRQSCCNSVQSSIVKFLYNLVQSIQSKHNWGTHRGIVPKTGILWQTTWGSNPTTIAKAKLTFLLITSCDRIAKELRDYLYFM